LKTNGKIVDYQLFADGYLIVGFSKENLENGI
jgi:hypothetical protein